jgi:NitT/TauT family transport system substrate-binding protein
LKPPRPHNKEEIMIRIARRLAAAFAACLFAATAAAQGLTPINISYQPALYWALPFYIATEKKWWAEVGLQASFSTFPAGAPQVAAAQAKSWDVGGTGSVPAVLGASRFGLVTVGITNDESAANALYAAKDKFDGFQKNPASIKGQKILLTTNSTGDYSVQSCLAKWGLKKADVQLVNLGQAQIISAVSSNNGDLAGVWAPNTYTLEEKLGARMLCSGKDAGAIVPGALVVRPDFAKENPETVAKFLAVYLRAWNWANANRDEAIGMMRAFYKQGGVEISDKALRAEFETRPTFDLAGQLKIMDRASGASQVDSWLTKIAEFMQAGGTLSDVPAAKAYITDDYLKLVDKDPKLKEFANRK